MDSALKIGVDVGGTNTDAALLCGSTVLGSCKVVTTDDVMSGVRNAVATVLDQSSIDPARVGAVMVGTTHFLNALVQRKHLSRVGVLRLCGPTSRALPPMVDWPDDLRGVIDGGIAFGDGGVEFNGDEITPINEAAIRQQCAVWRNSAISSIAVTAVFSLVNPECELTAARIISDEIPDVKISLSHQIGQNGLLQRENATILNASLQELSQVTINAFSAAFAELELGANLYLTQNDGTLMSADYAVRFPVQTIASGATNSMRGAAFLTGLTDAAVIDIGGTTTDIGIIVSGFPQTKSEGATLAGVRTNFRIVDRMKPSVTSIPAIFVGGGSVLVYGELDGVSEVIIPEHFGAANAIGAAIAQVSGEIDRIVSLDKINRATAIELTIDAAREQAVAAGAERESLGSSDLCD